MRGRPFVVVGLWVITFILPLGITLDLSVMCYHLTYVYHLPIDVLSSDDLACHYLARPFLLCHDLPDYYQSFDMLGCLLNIIILSCYHWTPSMIYLTCDYHLYGNLTCYPISWSVTCFPALHAVTWLYSIYVLLIPDHVHFLFFP